MLLQQETTRERPPPGFDDLIFVEQRQDVRIIVSVPGRYSLADHRNLFGERRVYSCRAVNVSPKAIALAAPNGGTLGERVMANIDHLGKLEGVVVRHLDRGFVMSINANDEDRAKLATKIEWLDRFKNLDIADQRSDVRFVPTSPYSWLLLADGHRETCFVSVDFGCCDCGQYDSKNRNGARGRSGRGPRRAATSKAASPSKFIMRQAPETVESLVIPR